jgi:predicted transglutaminase-like protease
MAKVSKNSRVDRGKAVDSKTMVKVIKAIKSDKSGAYSFREKFVHKDTLQEELKKA